MAIPIQITFRSVDPSPAVEDYVRRRAAKLETFSNRITRCHVTIEALSGRHDHSQPYRVRVELKMPGAELVVGDHSKTRPVTQDVYAVIDDTFDDAGRVVQEHVQRTRRDTKTHEGQA
jgi:ribosomal subunit interface protein